MKLLRIVLPKTARENLSDRLTENTDIVFWQVWDVESRFTSDKNISVEESVAGSSKRVCFEILASHEHIQNLLSSLKSCPMCERVGMIFWQMDVENLEKEQ